jgi:hypothetical protein
MEALIAAADMSIFKIRRSSRMIAPKLTAKSDESFDDFYEIGRKKDLYFLSLSLLSQSAKERKGFRIRWTHRQQQRRRFFALGRRVRAPSF